MPDRLLVRVLRQRRLSSQPGVVEGLLQVRAAAVVTRKLAVLVFQPIVEQRLDRTAGSLVQQSAEGDAVATSRLFEQVKRAARPGPDVSISRPSAAGGVARELDQLRKRVKELTLRLEREAKARKLDARLAAAAKKAREQLTREIKALLEHERKLASELKTVLGDAGKRQQALKEARGKVAELRAGLARKTAGLKRKSGELKKLAEESAHRAAAINTR